MTSHGDLTSRHMVTILHSIVWSTIWSIIKLSSAIHESMKLMTHYSCPNMSSTYGHTSLTKYMLPIYTFLYGCQHWLPLCCQTWYLSGQLKVIFKFVIIVVVQDEYACLGILFYCKIYMQFNWFSYEVEFNYLTSQFGFFIYLAILFYTRFGISFSYISVSELGVVYFIVCHIWVSSLQLSDNSLLHHAFLPHCSKYSNDLFLYFFHVS